jgi:hypothetical protein
MQALIMKKRLVIAYIYFNIIDQLLAHKKIVISKFNLKKIIIENNFFKEKILKNY